jgi:uncharacterized protein YggE
MKQLCMLVAILLITHILLAQNLPTCNPYPKTITVTGTSEMEITPNEIYVQIDLKEYKKKGEEKVELEIIKEEFLKNCKSVGIPDSLISIASFEGINGDDWWRKRKKDPQLLSSISYQIKFSEPGKMQLLAEKLNDEATANFRIVRVWHSQMTEFRKQIKINAIRAAKEKCIYLTTAVGEKISHAITISEQEPTIFSNPLQFNYGYSNTAQSDDKPGDTENSNVDFKKIKLEFSVSVVYALL